jgi:rfaE bifunctional protein nucleotidyltransferase chain/domain
MRTVTADPASFETICTRLDATGERASRRVVLGTGCFDIMHVGHLYFLQEASRQGDVLVIGVNSDRSVREIKGPSRPIVDEMGRATLLAALRCVDHVFVYDDVVADVQIRTLRPDVYVTGSESVLGYPSEVAAAHDIGARVHVIDRLPSHSTTSVVDEVQRRGRADPEQAPR